MLVALATARPSHYLKPIISALSFIGKAICWRLPAWSGGKSRLFAPQQSEKFLSAADGFVFWLDGRAAGPQLARTSWTPRTTHRDRGDGDMAALEKGITANGSGYGGKTWNILGQVYFPKAVTDSTFAFETNSEPGQFVPVHIHPTQDEFILVQEGVLDLKLDGVWVQAKAGDLVRLPRGIPHGYFNKSDKPARALFWVSPMQKLEALFNQLHNLTDPEEVVRISAQHEVNFLPPEANE
jgi:quercetin dioxygenase-like cupin family protein